MEETKTAPEAVNPEIVQPEAAEPGPKRSKYPSVSDVLVMLGIFLVCQFVGLFFSILLGLAPSASDPKSDPAMMGKMLGVSSLVANFLTLIALIAYRSMRGGTGPLVRFSGKGFNPVLILWGFVLLLAVGVVLEPLLNLLPPPPIEKFGTGVWTMATLVLIAPVFEELICRGVVLESLRTRYSVVVAWLVSSLFFGIIHFQAQQSVNAFFIGLILAFLYIRTNSIWIVIILHALNNAIAYLALSMGVDQNMMLSDLLGHGTLYAVVYIAAAALCAVSGAMVWRTLSQLRGQDKNRAAA